MGIFSLNKRRFAKKCECLNVWMYGQIEDVIKTMDFDISQTSMVSVEGLAKLVDPSQLTDDFEGSLDYNHEEWMDLRVSLEEFMSNAVHLLSRLEDLQVSTCISV